MFEPQYSEYKSEAFWAIINLLDSLDYKKNGSLLYKLGCELQNLEDKVLKEINRKVLELENRLAVQNSTKKKAKHV